MLPALGWDSFQRRETQVLGALNGTSTNNASGNAGPSYRDRLPERTRSLYAQAVNRLDVETLKRRVDANHIGIMEEAADVAGNFTKAMVTASQIFNQARFDAFAQRASFLFNAEPTRHHFNQLYRLAFNEVTPDDVRRFAKVYKGVESFGPKAVDSPFGHKHGRMLKRLLAAHLVYTAVHKNRPDSFPDRDRYDLTLARHYTTSELIELKENVVRVNPFTGKPQAQPSAIHDFHQGLLDRSNRVSDALDKVWPKPDRLQTTPAAFGQVAGDVTRVGRQALNTPELAVCDLMNLNARKMLGRAEWFYMHPGASYKSGKAALKPAEVVIEADMLQAVASR